MKDGTSTSDKVWALGIAIATIRNKKRKTTALTSRHQIVFPRKTTAVDDRIIVNAVKKKNKNNSQ